MSKRVSQRPFRVLSIDFDFFQETTADTVRYYYPDGVDLSTKLSEIVWSSKYMQYGVYKGYDELMKVTLSHNLFAQLQKILEKQNGDIPCIIAQSHERIYQELVGRIDQDQTALISHIDFHHDMFNDNHEVDCGNWVGKFVETHPNTQVTWFTREAGIECYGIEDVPDIPKQFNLDSLLNQEFDMVFLCRSDAWLPPHLDVYFNDLVLMCSDIFEDIWVEECVSYPRDITNIYDSAFQMSKFQQSVMDAIESKGKEIR